MSPDKVSRFAADSVQITQPEVRQRLTLRLKEIRKQHSLLRARLGNRFRRGRTTLSNEIDLESAEDHSLRGAVRIYGASEEVCVAVIHRDSHDAVQIPVHTAHPFTGEVG